MLLSNWAALFDYPIDDDRKFLSNSWTIY